MLPKKVMLNIRLTSSRGGSVRMRRHVLKSAHTVSRNRPAGRTGASRTSASAIPPPQRINAALAQNRSM